MVVRPHNQSERFRGGSTPQSVWTLPWWFDPTISLNASIGVLTLDRWPHSLVTIPAMLVSTQQIPHRWPWDWYQASTMRNWEPAQVFKIWESVPRSKKKTIDILHNIFEILQILFSFKSWEAFSGCSIILILKIPSICVPFEHNQLFKAICELCLIVDVIIAYSIFLN